VEWERKTKREVRARKIGVMKLNGHDGIMADGECFAVREYGFFWEVWIMRKGYRKLVSELVVKMASGRKMGEVLEEMGISMEEATMMLRGPIGRRVLKEMREMRELQRELVTGKGKAEEAAAPAPTGLTVEEMEAVLRESAEEARARMAE
jgi:hypothetical protein